MTTICWKTCFVPFMGFLRGRLQDEENLVVWGSRTCMNLLSCNRCFFPQMANFTKKNWSGRTPKMFQEGFSSSEALEPLGTLAEKPDCRHLRAFVFCGRTGRRALKSRRGRQRDVPRCQKRQTKTIRSICLGANISGTN